MNIDIWNKFVQHLLLGKDKKSVKLGIALLSDKKLVAYWRYFEEEQCRELLLPCIFEISEDYLIAEVLRECYRSTFYGCAGTSTEGIDHVKKYVIDHGHVE